ncbi:hypothetical protein [Nostoc sp.]
MINRKVPMRSSKTFRAGVLGIVIASETQLTSKYEKEGCQLWIL